MRPFPVNRHGINTAAGCSLYSVSVADFAALEQVSLPSSHTVLLIAADARGVHTDIIGRVAERLLTAGLVYVCTWGPDCQRVHDIFDEVYVGDGSIEPIVHFTSTWHSKEPLEEAIWFFLHCANPTGPEIQTVSYVAVTVADEFWSAIVDHALSNLSEA